MRWSIAVAVASDIVWALRRMTRTDARRAAPESWSTLSALRLERAHGRMGEAIAAARWTMTSTADVRTALDCLLVAP